MLTPTQILIVVAVAIGLTYGVRGLFRSALGLAGILGIFAGIMVLLWFMANYLFKMFL